MLELSSSSAAADYMALSKELYEEALNSIPFGEVPPGYEGENWGIKSKK